MVDKRIVPIAIGGSLGHLLAIEYALKPVLSVLSATEIFNTVYFLDRQIERLEADGYRINEEAEQRLNVELLKLAPAKIINYAREAVSKGLTLTQPFEVAFFCVVIVNPMNDR